MAVFYRYRSGVDTFSVPVPASFTSVGELKRLILGTSRHGHGRTRGRGPREDITLSDAQTGEEYTDDSALVLRNSTVVVRRVAGPPAETIIVASSPRPQKATQDSCSAARSGASAGAEDEEAKAISAVIDATELKWEGPSQWGRCYDRRGAAHDGGPPPGGYVCRRCRIPGHFIQHCPTNGDPRFDIGRATATPVLAPAPAAPVTATPDDGIPSGLHCKICSKVMADAVLTSKCCFSSFCDRCIRTHIVAYSKCACGARARADDLIPNPTLRAMIASALAARGSGASCGTEKPKSSISSNTVAEPTAPSESPAADSQESHVYSKKAAPSVSVHSNGSGGSTAKSATTPRTEQETTADDGAEARRNNHADQYGHSVPPGPTCYDPFFGGTAWAADPRMYYGGGMPYAYGGGYPMAAVAPHHVDAMGNVPVSYGHHGERHGRKRAMQCEDQRHPDRGFKRRCGGSRSQVALILT